MALVVGFCSDDGHDSCARLHNFRSHFRNHVGLTLNHDPDA